MTANDLEQLGTRLAKLEAFNRRLSRLVVVLLVVLAAAVWMGQTAAPKAQGAAPKAQRKKPAPAAPKVVEAEQFVLKTATGRVLATLGMTDGGPMLRLVGPTGTDRAVLALDQGGTPRFTLLRADGSQPLGLALNADGVPLVEVSAPDKSKAQLTIGPEGPQMALADASGVLRLALDLKKSGPLLTMGGKIPLAALSVDDTGSAFALGDPDGRRRLTMIVHPGEAVFGIRDANDNVLAGMQVKAESPALGLYTSSGKALFVKP